MVGVTSNRAELIEIENIVKVFVVAERIIDLASELKSEAITKNIEPNFTPTSISNNPGVKKYYVNAEKCFEYWIENSSDCGNCIKVCPFSGGPRTYQGLKKTQKIFIFINTCFCRTYPWNIL